MDFKLNLDSVISIDFVEFGTVVSDEKDLVKVYRRQKPNNENISTDHIVRVSVNTETHRLHQKKDGKLAIAQSW